MDKTVRPVFSLELNCKISPSLVTIGKYDGTHPCITAATNADKVIIHSPHRRNSVVAGRIVWSESNREIAALNINQTITCLVAGLLVPDDDKDVLVIGTGTHILAYHVHDNRDVFYQECSDGVKCLALGSFGTQKNIVLVGGNSSVYGYDYQGNEVFWTAVGDTVTSILLMDYNKDGLNELIVSSEDYYIRVYKNDQTIAEHLETEVVTNLVGLPDYRFAYSVSNGTVGVYEQDVRLWRVKSKHFAVAIVCYDLLGQTGPQLLTCWSNGKIDCRSISTGEVLFKDSMSSPAAGLVEGDYRSIGKTDVVCVSTEGEVRGYTTTKTFTTEVANDDQNVITELLAQKQSLLMELKHYENNTNFNENVLNQTESYESSGVIPANTRLQIAITTSENAAEKPHVEIYISTNNKTIIRSVIIFAEGIFKGETHVVHPSVPKLSTEMTIPLVLPKDNPVDIHIKALIGYPKSVQFHVFEITRQMPRFSMYCLQQNPPTNKPKGFLECRINERLQRICLWINQNFLFSSDIEFDTGPNLTMHLRSLRDCSDLTMVFEISGKVMVMTDNMFLAADLVQSLANYLKLDSLESTASFPIIEDKVKVLMEKLTDIEDARLRLGTDVADRLGQIRGLVVRAEDARLNDLKEMPGYYKELNVINKELINGYNIKVHNFNEGVETMKQLNSIIQKASRLRVGQRSAQIINHARNCIKSNNIDGLIKVIRTGDM